MQSLFGQCTNRLNDFSIGASLIWLLWDRWGLNDKSRNGNENSLNQKGKAIVDLVKDCVNCNI